MRQNAIFREAFEKVFAEPLIAPSVVGAKLTDSEKTAELDESGAANSTKH